MRELREAKTREEAERAATRNKASDEYLDPEDVPDNYKTLAEWQKQNSHAPQEQVAKEASIILERDPQEVVASEAFQSLLARGAASEASDLILGEQGSSKQAVKYLLAVSKAAGKRPVLPLNLKFAPGPQSNTMSEPETFEIDSPVPSLVQLQALKRRLISLSPSSPTLTLQQQRFMQDVSLPQDDTTGDSPGRAEPPQTVVISDVPLKETEVSQLKSLQLSADTSISEAVNELDRQMLLNAEVSVAPASAPVVRSGMIVMSATASASGPQALTEFKGGYVQGFKVSDLEVAERDLKRYEAGEIAHIENALKGERRVREHIRNTLREDVTFVETSILEATEEELQTEERFGLTREARDVQRSEVEKRAGLKLDASYGPSVNVETYADFSLTTFSESVSTTASEYAKTVSSLATARIQRTFREQRLTRRVESVEETNSHEIDNRNANGHTVGIYRYVDKVYSVQVRNYGVRLMLEFVLPEPGANLLRIASQPVGQVLVLDKPEPPRVNGKPLELSDIDPINDLWRVVAARYGAAVEPLPEKKVVSLTLKFDEEPNLERDEVSRRVDSNTDAIRSVQVAWDEGILKVPDGYEALRVWGTSLGFNTTIAVSFDKHRAEKVGAEQHVKVYGSDYVRTGQMLGGFKVRAGMGRAVDLIERYGAGGDLYVSAISLETEEHNYLSSVGLVAAAHGPLVIEALCTPTKETWNTWRYEVYTAIMEAYRQRQAAYLEALAAEEVAQGTSIDGRNPTTNREVERDEIKRGVVTLLRGSKPDTGSLAQDGFSPDVVKAAAHGPLIRFFETAFEWEHMVFELAPYFWANLDRWDQLLKADDPDPEHRRFLQAGSAHVTLPVRPGHEFYAAAAVSLLQMTGGSLKPELFTSEPPNVILRELLIASLEASVLRKQRQTEGPVDVGKPFEVTVPTNLVILQEGSDLNEAKT